MENYLYVMIVFTVVSIYIEVSSEYCRVETIATNEVCARLTGSTTISTVCKAGHGGIGCNGITKLTHI